jgi:hypothetical protein
MAGFSTDSLSRFLLGMLHGLATKHKTALPHPYTNTVPLVLRYRCSQPCNGKP